MKYKPNLNCRRFYGNALWIVLIVCANIIISSCASGDWVKYRMSRSYIQSISDIKYENISDTKKPFRTDGYYSLKERNTAFADNREYIIIFYNDGTFSEHLIISPKESVDTVEIGNHFVESNPLFNHGEYFGVYRIENDTIFANKYRRSLFAGLEMYKLKYKIIDSETLCFCYLEDPQQIYRGETIKWDRDQVYVFKLAKLPKTRDKFLKKKKWIWKNEADWERYMGKDITL